MGTKYTVDSNGNETIAGDLSLTSGTLSVLAQEESPAGTIRVSDTTSPVTRVLNIARDNASSPLSSGLGVSVSLQGPGVMGGVSDYALLSAILTNAIASEYALAVSVNSGSGLLEVMRLIGGKVGIGTATPTSLLSVGASNQFQVDSNGDAVKIKNVTYSWPSLQGAASTVLQNDGSGNLTWTVAGITAAGSTGAVQFNSSNAFAADVNNFFWDNVAKRLGIGTSTPVSLLSVGASNQFQVDSNGDAVKIKNVTYSWPSLQGAASTVLQNDGSGNLTWTVAGAGAPATYSRTVGTGNGSTTIFTTPSYVIGNSSLLVFVDGVLMSVGADYTETTVTSVTFNVAPLPGASLSFLVASSTALGTAAGATGDVQLNNAGAMGTASTVPSLAGAIFKFTSAQEIQMSGSSASPYIRLKNPLGEFYISADAYPVIISSATGDSTKFATFTGGNVRLGGTTPAANTRLDVTGNTRSTQFTDVTNALGNSGAGTVTFDWSTGAIATVTLTGNATFAFSNAIAGQTLTLIISTGAGGFAPIWPTISWPSATPPTITATASKKDVITIFFDGTTYYGFVGGQNY